MTIADIFTFPAQYLGDTVTLVAYIAGALFGSIWLARPHKIEIEEIEE